MDSKKERASRGRPSPRAAGAIAAYHHGSLRQALIDGGIALLARVGPAGFSLRALAQELGVSHAAPYRHFASREELLAEIVAESWRRFNEAIAASASDAVSAEEKIYLLGEAYVRFFLAKPEMLYLFETLPNQLAAGGEELARILFPNGALGDADPDKPGEEGFNLLRLAVSGLMNRFPGLGPRDVVLGYWAKAHGLASLLVAQPDYFAPEGIESGLRRVLRQAF
jgi:AcrR family transcriptional regulator